MPEENLYELLQVEPTADSRTIRAAYRMLMLLPHPARNACPAPPSLTHPLNLASAIPPQPAT